MEQEQILSRLLSDISDEFDKSVGSFFYDIDKPVAEIMAEIYKKVEGILKNGFALTATGKYLDVKVAEQGITRKPSTASTVVVTITGIPGSAVSVGDKVASDVLVFTSIENKTIGESETIDVMVQCDMPGTVGNIPIGAINRFPVTLPGLVSVTNSAPAEGGFDEESDEELRRRYFEKVSLPATSGSKYHYIMWAKEVSGVGDAKCIPLPREALEVDYDENTQSGTITLEEFFESVVPPTETCNIVSSIFANEFVILSGTSTLKCSETAVSFGGESTGNKSFATANAKATGDGSFAANSGRAENTNAAAFGSAYALARYSFGANSARCEGSYSAAFNSSNNYTQYSISVGCGTKILGRALKGVSINGTASTVTIESGQNTTGIVGKKIIMRCYNQMNSYMLKEGVVDAVNDTVLTVSGMNFNTYYPESLFPDKYIFIVDTSASYSTSDLVSGYYAFATSKYTFAHGMYVTTAKDGSVIFGKYGTSDDEYSLALANGTSLKEQGLAFKVLSDGRVNADGAYTTPCADYAEFFEWADGNQDYEDRAGYFVKLEGEKIVKCNDFDEPLGIVSATPAIIGDSGELHWKDKFVTDDFGRIKYHDVVVPQETDEEGNVLIEEHIETHPVINPEWNNDEEYIPRNKRPEWSAVGVLGKLIVYDDGTLKAGDVCRTGPGGIAVKSVKNGYQVLKRISDDKIMIWFKG